MNRNEAKNQKCFSYVSVKPASLLSSSVKGPNIVEREFH